MNFTLDVVLHPSAELSALFRKLEASMSDLSTKLDNATTHLSQLTDALSNGVTQLSTVGTNIAGAMDGMAAEIADLKSQLANQGVDQATLDKVDAIAASADGARTAFTDGLAGVVKTLTDAANRDVTPA